MAAEKILIDSTICIEYFRKKNKARTVLYHLVDDYDLSISIVTTFEVKVGLISEWHYRDFENIIKKIQVISLDDLCIDKAVEIFHQLKMTNS